MGGLAASAEIACGAPFYGAPQLAILNESLHSWTPNPFDGNLSIGRGWGRWGPLFSTWPTVKTGSAAVSPEVNFPLFDAVSLKKPVQGHFGELDAMAGFSDAATGKKLEADLRAGGNSNVEVFIYPKVGHAFMNDSPSPFPTFEARMEKMGAGFPPYDAATADLAWSRLFAFFSKHL